MNNSNFSASRARTLSVVGLITSLALSGCATKNFVISPKLHQRSAEAAAEPKDLAGDLDHALDALYDQRRLFWEAAEEIEAGKSITALGLMGLAGAGIYRGAQGTANAGWMQRAGLAGSLTWAGATWFEPNARQKIFLAGADSLTCLASISVAYEMPTKQHGPLLKNIEAARGHVEALYSQRRLLQANGLPASHPALKAIDQKTKYAQRVLNEADKAMGNLDSVGTRLRGLTALTSAKVAREINEVSQDLEKLPAAIASLKPQANLLMGAKVFDVSQPPDPDSPAPDAPGGKSDAKSDSSDCPTPAPATTSTSNADAAGGNDKGKGKTTSHPGTSPAARQATPAPMASLKQDQLTALSETMRHLDEQLGPVVSFVQRIAQATRLNKLPAACVQDSIELVPDKRSLVLSAAQSFQFLLEGDPGRAQVQIIGESLEPGTLDISSPLDKGQNLIRVALKSAPTETVQTTLRITDSKGQVHFDVALKLCKK